MYFSMFYVFAFFSVIEASKLNLWPTLDENGRELTGFEVKITDGCEKCEVLPLIKRNEQEDLKLKYLNILAKIQQRASKRPLNRDETAVLDENDKIRYITNDIINNINDLTNINDNVEENYNKYYDENRINRIKYNLNRFDNGISNDIKYNPFNVYDIQNEHDNDLALENNNEHRLKKFKVKLNRFVNDRSKNTKYNTMNLYDNQNNYALNKFVPENVRYDVDGYQSIKYNPLNFHNTEMKYDYNEPLLEDDKSKAKMIQLKLNRLKVDQYENALNKYYNNINNQVNDDGSTHDPYNVYDRQNKYGNDHLVNKMRPINYDDQNKHNEYENIERVEEMIKSDFNRYSNGVAKHNPNSNFDNKNKKKNKFHKHNLNGNIAFNMDDVNDNRRNHEDGFKFW